MPQRLVAAVAAALLAYGLRASPWVPLPAGTLGSAPPTCASATAAWTRLVERIPPRSCGYTRPEPFTPTALELHGRVYLGFAINPGTDTAWVASSATAHLDAARCLSVMCPPHIPH
ncbi:MAG TPA: hypothetical protein VET65_02470 [Candidatus Limnocylindrales bacterium]|nr:hypothetical protein [Candidatus Limnocylindrales bacterium]